VVDWDRIFPHLGFKCGSNFWTFVEMLVIQLGNVWHCEFSLQTSSSVNCFNHSISMQKCEWNVPSIDPYTCVAGHLYSSDLNLNPKWEYFRYSDKSLTCNSQWWENSISTSIFKLDRIWLFLIAMIQER
jgi:hypothetical protein